MIRLTPVGRFWVTYLALVALCVYCLLKAVGAFGNPFLVCDPQDRVEWYEIDGLDIDGTHLPPVMEGTQGHLSHDLQGLTVGATYDISVRACNVWGCSSDVPFSFTPKDAPPTPSPLTIVP